VKRLPVLLIVVALLVGFGVATATTPSNARVRGVVLFIGDSNITFTSEAIDFRTTWLDHSDNGYVPVLASRVGAAIRDEDCLDASTCTTTDYWKVKIAAIRQSVTSDAFVNDLGINDTEELGTATTRGYASYGAKIDWFMALLPPDKPVIWTNLPCQVEPSNLLAGCHAVNDALAAAPARWPNLTVANWAAQANSHPEYMQDSSVHYTQVGQMAWAKFVVNQLDQKLAAVS